MIVPFDICRCGSALGWAGQSINLPRSRRFALLLLSMLSGLLFWNSAITAGASSESNVCHELEGYICQTEGDWAAGWYIANHGEDGVPGHLLGEAVGILAHWPNRKPQGPLLEDSGQEDSDGRSRSGSSCRVSMKLGIRYGTAPRIQPDPKWSSNCSDIKYVDAFNSGIFLFRRERSTSGSFPGIRPGSIFHLTVEWTYFPSKRMVYWVATGFRVEDCRPDCPE